MIRLGVVALLLASALIAGCVGDDEPGVADPDEGGEEPAQGVRLSGAILTVNLDPVKDARVLLVQGEETVAEAGTDDSGNYVFNTVSPGDYRLHVTATCCKEHVRAVVVEEGSDKIVDIQMELYSDDDLQIPRKEQLEWTGFLACTFRWPSAPAVPSGINACSIVDGVSEDFTGESATDDDFLREFKIKPGLKSLVGGAVWSAPGASLGDQLNIFLEVSGRWNDPPRYVDAEGPSPLEFRVDEGDVIENYESENIHEYDFANVTEDEELELGYRIFAGGDANIVYQQQFTLYWDLYYWEPATEEASALPDD